MRALRNFVLPLLLLSLFGRVVAVSFAAPMYSGFFMPPHAQLQHSTDSAPVADDSSSLDLKVHKRHRRSREQMLKAFMTLPASACRSTIEDCRAAPELVSARYSPVIPDHFSRPPSC